MAELISPTDNTFFICPLYAFNYDVASSKRVDLGGEIVIWRIPHSLRDLVDRHYRELHLRQNNVEWVIQIPPNPKGRESLQNGSITSVELMSYGYRLHDDVRETMIDVVTDLRLQHAGNVAPGPLIYVQSTGKEFSLGHVTIWTRLSKTGSLFAPAECCYELLQTEVKTLRNFWQRIPDRRKTGKLNEMEIAMRRFNSSYGEGLEDRLLDQMIALESLYLVDPQELSYKLALRAAFFIGADEKKRKQVRKDLKDAYNARSKIIHGKKPPANLPELVVKTEEYLRQSIRHILKLSDKYTLKQLRGPLNKANQQEDSLFDQNILSDGRLLKA